MSYAQKCCRTKIKLTLAVTNRKCRRNWFKTTQNGEQNNPLGVAKKGGLETKFEETAGQMTVGHIRSYKFVRFGLKGLNNGTCIDGVHDYKCTCVLRFVGKNCSNSKPLKSSLSIEIFGFSRNSEW